MAILAYCLVMGVITLTKFHLGLYSLFDLGIHAEATHLVAFRLNPFLTTRGMLLQGDHFAPMIYLWAPLYRLAPDPRTLLLGQVLWLSLGAAGTFF